VNENHLSLERSTKGFAEPADDSAASSLSGDAPINILIVDDEPKNLTVLEAVLDDPCYRLVRAESADEALLALLVDEFALLILDIRMPGVTGFELAQTIKERKKTSRVPIIFLTAYYNEDQHLLEGYGTGAVDYLLKPVVPAILRSKVAIFAELYRKQREVELANRALLAEVSSRRRAEEELRELNNTLEQHVNERTASLRLLMSEVNHRSKNLLSVVQAIAKQTAAASPAEFVSRFSERIRALAASHDLLVKCQWARVEMFDLLYAQLTPFKDLIGRRVFLEGPPFRLSVAAAQVIGMVLHELVTNASKHGALSNQVGRVAIDWQVEGTFVIKWVESGGPNVGSPTQRGFGSTVIKKMAELSLDGEVVLNFAPSGLFWRLECPLAKILDKDKIGEEGQLPDLLLPA
jgi:two-component sensor histidine kinase